MYLEPWQVFLGGCVIGTLISFITLTIIIINFVGKLGIGGIRIRQANAPEVDDEDDLVAKLSYILLSHGVLSESDIEFMEDQVTFEEWKTIQELKKHNDKEKEL